MKEAEIDALVMPWGNTRVAHLLLVCRMMPMEVGDCQKRKLMQTVMTVDVHTECRDHRALSS